MDLVLWVEDLGGEESAPVNYMLRTAGTLPGSLGMLLLTQQPPMVHWVSRAPQSSNGANTSVLVVTLPASCRPGPFKELVHAATAFLMAHQSVPWAVLLRCPRIKVPLCRGHKVIF